MEGDRSKKRERGGVYEAYGEGRGGGEVSTFANIAYLRNTVVSEEFFFFSS